ncbi:hypothetical protein [Actinoplanes octamycinicus]|uniref:hypothetical protein n=1 Tax=Actinoplanes octamycinicus TaxID=135948 RepID=UPI0035EDDC14
MADTEDEQGSAAEATVEAVPTDTEVQAVPFDTEVQAVPSDTEVQAVPFDTEVQAVPSDTEVQAVPFDTEVQAASSDTEVQVQPLDAKGDVRPFGTEGQAQPSDTGDVDKTEHAPLAQWASRVGARPQPAPGSGELQTPADPWPEPIQGLVPPIGQPPFAGVDLPGYAYPAPAPATPQRRHLGAVLAVTAVALLVGAAGVLVALWPDDKKGGPDGKKGSPVAAPSGAVTEKRAEATAGTTIPGSARPTTATPTGPAPLITPLNIFDVDPICGGEGYWPAQPKRAGKAPHPVLVYGDLGSGERMPFTMFETWFLHGKVKEATWSSQQDPAKIQLVACVDRVSVGAKLRTCTYTDPDRGTGTLFRASYRLHVYEAATGRKLLDKKLKGTEKDCPYTLRVPTDKKLFMQVSEDDLVAALGKLVEG